MADLGADLRALRKTKGITLTELAERLGKSVGWLSQIERGISKLSSEDIDRLADVFDVAPSLLDGREGPDVRENGIIVRSSDRRMIGERVPGLVEELLSPDLTDSFEVIHSTFLPGSEREDAINRPTQELAFLVSGKLKIWLEDEPFLIRQGDSFRIRGDKYRWANPFDEPAVAVWIISPPVY
ncbi:helix-turn-helix domain-containing protein [Roseibium sp.]|uniref:helix-turn-helix domain-containing protein n=1 Tax=Roseibium sp. TaxID=1936156 RepID=UPI003B52D3CD